MINISHSKKWPLILFIGLTQCQSKSTKTAASEPLSPTVYAEDSLRHSEAAVTAVGKKFVVSTQGIYATKAAKEILAAGGNIIDAAVAASLTISVERPHSTGLGGGGFLLFYNSKTKKTVAADFRERAPLRATKNMYIQEEGKASTDLSQNGGLAVGTPGLIAGLYEVHHKYGKLKWEKLFGPAISLAENGFPVYRNLAKAMNAHAETLKLDSEVRKIFFKNDKPMVEGDLLVQKDLANTLRLISKGGKEAFYRGFIARNILATAKKTGGILTRKDLDVYKVIWRKPISSQFQGMTVMSMPPPSSGGVHVLQYLNMMEEQHLTPQDYMTTHALLGGATALQLAFADRAHFMGDPDFVKVPTEMLISKAYNRQRISILKDTALKSFQVSHGEVVRQKHESTETSHMSLMDEDGNTVATTQTINGWMGAKIVAEGTGIVLNNEMDDFSLQAGVPNMFGAIGGEANSIAPLKTPLSSMSPTIVIQNGTPVMAVGAPGGTRIISCVAETIFNYYTFKRSLFDSIASVRYHHQWSPDTLDMDAPGPGATTLNELKTIGYNVNLEGVPCNVMAVVREGDSLRGVSDPRDIGTSFAE